MSEKPQIPGIEIVGELGRGAHSVVYSARQQGVRCAVKVPRAKARWSRWIYREAVALARVKHPSLPAVLEVGELDGLPFLVMELVEGETLAERLDRGLDEDEVVQMAAQLASVLGAVHAAGLVHRDVKPRNILIERATGKLKLVDFGFATPMERVGQGETAGTAAYAAPEQLVPAGEIDGRTDLYALGRLMFEALSQRLTARIANTSSADETRAELVSQGVSPPLSEIVAGLVQTAREQRYPDAHALLAELTRVQRGQVPLGAAGYPHASRRSLAVVRKGERERLGSAFRGIRSAGAVALLKGGRGSGKSELLRACEADLLAAGLRVIRISSRQDDAPLATLRRIVEATFDLVSENDLATAIGNLGPVVHTIAPKRAAIDPGSSRVLASDGAGEAIGEGAAELLLRLATRFGPLAIFVDDAHWMDPVSGDALKRLAHRSAEAPIALLFAARREQPDSPFDRLVSVRPTHTIVIELSTLTETQSGELIASHLGEPSVDPALVTRIHTIAGGTPLGVSEVLGAFLDGGVLRPHAGAWRFDVALAERVVLPQGALVLLGRRLSELPAATLRVLELAAIVGTVFDEAIVARALELRADDLAFGLAGARRAGLLEPEAAGRHRFVHDSLREMLVEDLPEAERRRLHQRMADVYDSVPEPTFEDLCASATHFAAGDPAKDPARVYRVARAACEAAVARFDNETALRFHAQAASAAERGGIVVDADFFAISGEAHLRLGLLDDSRAAFESALGIARSRAEEAILFGRLAWVEQARGEPEKAWTTLAQAFAAVGERLPGADFASAASTSARFARMRVRRLLRRESGARSAAASVDLLCALHYQNARLGLEYGKPAQLIQSGLQALELSERGGSLAAQARAHAFYALVMAALQRREASERSLARAKALAERERDPATMAFCAQFQAIVATWLGDLDRAIVLFRECVDVHGPWLELQEYCGVVASAETIQSIRGRASEAWPWIERALDRLRRSRTRPVVAEFLIQRARAGFAAVGRDVQDDPWLAGQFAAISPQDPGRGFHRVAGWGPCARFYLEKGELDEEFEELVRAFQAEGIKPKSAHIGVSDYYVSVVHARVHQCLRAGAAEQVTHRAALRRAVSDLRAAAKIPLFQSHSLLGQAWLAWFEGEEKQSKKLLASSESIANQQSCPWVLYGVARLRAHTLRQNGREEAARDQARVAELLARDHGAVTRARWIREEFTLLDSTAPLPNAVVSSHRSSSSRTNRQLSALLQVVTAARRDLKAEQQAAAILDELIGALHAERGAIWFQPEPGVTGTAVARHRSSHASVSIAPESTRGALLREVHQSGQAWPPADAIPIDGQAFDPSRFVAVPLSLYDKPVGALCVERASDDPPFAPDDRSLLHLLAHQVPIALEIARLLFEREQLHASLQHAKKMEAMGALAGGLAHDFNNMLAAMRVALSAAQERAVLDVELTVELDIISQATTRAAQLTSQLLSFSRHQPVPVAVHDINQLVSTLEPMLRRVVGARTNITVKLSPAVDAVEVDQGSFDQAIVNLLINARDAMPSGGTVTIATRNVVLGESAAQRASLPAGEYVEIEVADTGEGMTHETMSRIFEPFFTTKPVGSGSGLGLAMVYAFARNCGGSIEVESEVGQGTQFRIYLKRVQRSRTSRPVRSITSKAPLSSAEIRQDGPDTILVVDDDDLVRRSIAKILERNGYRVLAASGSAEALTVAREQGRRIALVILDVLMPGVTGPELGRRLDALNLGAKVLFVSGFSPESIPLEDAQVASDMLLQKPFSQTTLLERVRQLMNN